jgi:peptidoglycan/LPS O-acetylase OafA/YrhL
VSVTNAPSINGDTAHASVLRQDIQQLRGIAVLAVIINHLGIAWLPGGYLGVDMFFVLSGYVITLSMLSGQSSAGSRARFFVQFWIRRMFRLWPMLFVTVVTTTAVLVATGLANPEPLITGLASVVALSNFRLLYGRLEYFAIDTGADWFMHTWSLAVEEQIYVMLSVVFALFGIRRTSVAAPAPVRALAIAVSLLVIVSLVFVFIPFTSEVVRFYAPHTRFYQVGAGALIALWLTRRSSQAPNESDGMRRRICDSFIAASAVGIVVLFVVNPWSGRVVSLATTALTAIIIAAASARHHIAGFASVGSGAGRWLSRVGDRSYSLYLVHWPIQMASSTLIEATFPQYAMSLALTLLLGYAGYRFVENRTRHRWQSMQTRRATALAATALLIAFGVTALGYYRTDRISRAERAEVPPERCTREDASLWVVGDSHFTHAPLEPVVAKAVNSNCLFLGGYGFVMEVVWLDRESAGQREVRMKLTPTARLVDQIRSAAVAPRVLMVVHFLSAFLAEPSTAPASANFVATEWQAADGTMVSRDQYIVLFAEHLRQLAEALAERGGQLVVTSPPPDFNWLRNDIDPALCSNRLVVSRECALYRSEARISLVAHSARGGAVRGLLEDLQRDLPNVKHIRLDTPFCGSNYCSNFHDGKPVFQDDDHLNIAGALMVEPLFSDVLTGLK